jgi:hypothetical protein
MFGRALFFDLYFAQSGLQVGVRLALQSAGRDL